MVYSGVMLLCSSEVSIEAVESPAFSSRNPSPRLWGGEFLSMPAESRDNRLIKKIWNYALCENMWSISMHFCFRLHLLPFSFEIVVFLFHCPVHNRCSSAPSRCLRIYPVEPLSQVKRRAFHFTWGFDLKIWSTHLAESLELPNANTKEIQTKRW